MATISGIQGMLLEEALLFLLEISGYRVVYSASVDPHTLHDGHSGLEVLGRGGKHQIDAVADYILAHPFSNPQRLLVEAKCYSDSRPVNIEIVRNAVGVLKDVSEFWVTGIPRPANNRYHYQYAVFSASGYTADAQGYAYAQDIYLIPLEKSQYIAPLIAKIRQLSHLDFGATSKGQININMKNLRTAVRKTIRDLQSSALEEIDLTSQAVDKLHDFCLDCNRMQGAILAMIADRFPVFLIPAPNINIRELSNRYDVRITRDEQGWYLSDDRSRLFSFDLPRDLFDMYAENGLLTKSRALDLKRESLNSIHALITIGESTQAVTFELDQQWLSQVRQPIGTIRRRRRR